MHQYTADLAERALAAGDAPVLATTRRAPSDRYGKGVQLVTPAATGSTGMELHTLRLDVLRRVAQAVLRTGADVAHFTGPHLWNPWLVCRLQRAGMPVVHTIHDLEPHSGKSPLLHLWNGMIISRADHLLVHGEVYRLRLIAQGVPGERITSTPLTHLFVGAEMRAALGEAMPVVTFDPQVLFFGRLETYKGVGDLLAAWEQVEERGLRGAHQLVLAGQGRLPEPWRSRGLPPGVEVRNRLIGDEEAVDLFRRCRLVVLPYKDATQSALIAAAYFFCKPVLATRTGALPEYVIEGETGWLAEPGNPAGLAEALAAALSDPDKPATLGSAGRSWYNDRRAWYSGTVQAVYEHVGR